MESTKRVITVNKYLGEGLDSLTQAECQTLQGLLLSGISNSKGNREEQKRLNMILAKVYQRLMDLG